jgi:hypothetical protein
MAIESLAIVVTRNAAGTVGGLIPPNAHQKNDLT